MATIIPLKKTGIDDMRKSNILEDFINGGKRKDTITRKIYANVITMEMATRESVIFNLDATS